MPAWSKPQLTRLIRALPGGDEWAHELEFDGYRMHARLDRGDVRLLTRTGLDWINEYPAIVAAFRKSAGQAGLSRWGVVRATTGQRQFFCPDPERVGSREGADLVYFIFDPLHLDSRNLMPLPLADRKSDLATLLERGDGAIRYSDNQIG